MTNKGEQMNEAMQLVRQHVRHVIWNAIDAAAYENNIELNTSDALDMQRSLIKGEIRKILPVVELVYIEATRATPVRVTLHDE